jgi:hypothetical protein
MGDQRIVAFDLMSRDPDYYFVLTEALQEFAARERSEAEDLDEHDAAQRIRWAETAETALDRIEEALSMPATIEDVVADSIEQQSAYRNELRHLPGYMSRTGGLAAAQAAEAGDG